MESKCTLTVYARYRFQTDGSETGRGFSISYTMVDPPPTEEPTTDAPLTGQAEVGINGKRMIQLQHSNI